MSGFSCENKVQTSSVSNLSDLPNTGIQGEYCWVSKRGRLYQFINNDWISTQITDPAWASASLYISSSGNDDAPGTLQDPIKTTAEFIARLGQTPIQQSTLTVLDSLNEEKSLITGNFAEKTNKWIWIQGVPQVALTTTVSSKTDWNLDATNNTVGIISGSSSISGYSGSGGFSGNIWRISSGDRSGSYGVFGANEGSGNVVFIPGVTELYVPGSVTPEISDEIEILNLPTLCNELVVGSNCVLFIDSLSFGETTHSISVGTGSYFYASACKILGGLDVLSSAWAEITACGCNDSLRLEGGGSGGSGSYLNITNSHTQSVVVRPGGVCNISNIISQRVYSLEPFSFMQLTDGFLFFDSPVTNSSLNVGANALFDAVGNINGRNSNGNPGRILLGTGGRLNYTVKPNITGTGTQWYAAGTTGNFSALPVSTTNGTYIVLRTL